MGKETASGRPQDPRQERPQVSVVTIFYNRAALVQDSMASLLAQTHPSFEILAVDDGSTDDTLAALRSIADPRLRVIAKPNGGFTASMNYAVGEARGEFVAVHGSGDTSFPERLERQAAILAERPEVGVVGCHVRNDKNEGDGYQIAKYPDGLPFTETMLDRALFTHGEVMFRKSIFDKVGGYREGFIYGQDRDLWLRMSEHTGYAIAPEVLYHRRKIAGSVSLDPQKRMLQAYYSNLAVESARLRGKGGRDLVEAYGPLALLMKPKSRPLATKLAWAGARFMVSGDVKGGWAMVEQARREFRTPMIDRIYLACLSHKNSVLWRTATSPLLRRKLKSVKSFDW